MCSRSSCSSGVGATSTGIAPATSARTSAAVAASATRMTSGRRRRAEQRLRQGGAQSERDGPGRLVGQDDRLSDDEPVGQLDPEHDVGTAGLFAMVDEEGRLEAAADPLAEELRLARSAAPVRGGAWRPRDHAGIIPPGERASGFDRILARLAGRAGRRSGPSRLGFDSLPAAPLVGQGEDEQVVAHARAQLGRQGARSTPGCASCRC